MKNVLALLLVLSFLPACSSTSSESGEVSAKTTKKKTCIEKRTTGSRLAKKVCKA